MELGELSLFLPQWPFLSAGLRRFDVKDEYYMSLGEAMLKTSINSLKLFSCLRAVKGTHYFSHEKAKVKTTAARYTKF